MKQDVTQLNLKELLNLLHNKKISSVEVTQAYLDKIEKLEPKLNAFITVEEKQKVLEQAKEADKQIAAGNIKKLTGVPIALKDNFLAKDTKTTAGSKVLDNFIAPYDATAVARLKQEGAIIIGKLNMDAWAHGSSGENSDFGPTKNPWHLEYTPGGSSSGPASAIAAGMAPVATGTDTGGSIRLPAGFTGTVGIKPTYGRVSRYGVVAMASSTDSIGHFTRTVWDNAYILSITAGKDKYDATTSDLPVSEYYNKLDELNPKDLKVGIIKEFFNKDILEDSVLQKNQEAVNKLEKLGATIKEISIKNIERGLELYYILMSAEVASNLARYDGVRYGHTRETFGEEAKRRIMLGTYVLSDVIPGKGMETTYAKTAQARGALQKEFDKAFKEVDVLLCPVSPTLPFKLGSKAGDPLQMYMSDLLTVTFSIVGIPGLTVPVDTALNSEGVELPVGVQIVGPNFSELLLYQVGALIENPQILNKINLDN